MTEAPEYIHDTKRNMWGCAINIQEQVEENVWRVYGHHDRAKDGAKFLCTMKSGLRAVFQLRAFRRCTDPPDMFFAEAVFLGYLEEVKEE